MQHTVCIESICTIQTLSAHTVHSWVGLCIPHLHCAFRTTLFLAPPTYLGEFLHSAPASCIGTLSFLSWLWVSFCILHSASCILHVSHSCSFGPTSAFCILHLHSASGAARIFGADSAFCMHPAFCMLHKQSKHFGLGSAFCILHLHSAFSEKYGM